LIQHSTVKVIINIGYEGMEQVRGYRNIVPYAIAKQGVQILTHSLALNYPGIAFHMVTPPNLEAAEVMARNIRTVKADKIAEEIFLLGVRAILDKGELNS